MRPMMGAPMSGMVQPPQQVVILGQPGLVQSQPQQQQQQPVANTNVQLDPFGAL